MLHCACLRGGGVFKRLFRRKVTRTLSLHNTVSGRVDALGTWARRVGYDSYAFTTFGSAFE